MRVSVRLTSLSWFISLHGGRRCTHARTHTKIPFQFNLKTCRHLTWILCLESQAPWVPLSNSSSSGEHVIGFLWSWHLSKHTVPAMGRGVHYKNQATLTFTHSRDRRNMVEGLFFQRRTAEVKRVKLVPGIKSNLMFSTGCSDYCFSSCNLLLFTVLGLYPVDLFFSAYWAVERTVRFLFQEI